MKSNRWQGDSSSSFLLCKGRKGIHGGLVGVLAVALASGCGHKLAEETVLTGTVTYGGEVLREGRVTLWSQEGKMATAPIQADGGFRLVNPPRGTVQAAVTTYPIPVVVSPDDTTKQIKGGKKAFSTVPPPPQVRLPARFADPATSPLTFHIAPSAHVLDIHLPCLAGDSPIVKPSDIPQVGTQVGQESPDIAGEDLDGHPFKLSDYRGKVVVVLFWGHW